MSGTGHHQYPAIELTEVPIQHVEDGTPQHNGLSPPHNRSSSQDTLVSTNNHEPAGYDTQAFVREVERGLYPTYTARQAGRHPGVVENTHPYRPSEYIRPPSLDSLVSVDDRGPIRYDTQRPIYEPTRDQYSLVQTVEGVHQDEGSPSQQQNRGLAQNIVDRSKLIQPVLRRPVPTPVERHDQYVPIQQTEVSPPNKYPLPKVGERGLTPFLSYGLALLFVFLMSLGFWMQSRRRPIFFSRNSSIWMVRNPKTMTMLWTSVAAFLAWCTLWLHACTVSLMARKLIIRGAKISTIECWVKLSHNGAMVDRHRPWLSLYTALAAITTALLTVGFAGLLTPIPMLKFNGVSAVEIDMTTDVFKAWYNNATEANRPKTGFGCKWYTHENPRDGQKYTFPTCPFRDDSSLVLQAGRSAVEQGFHLNSITKIGDVNFNGTTGGTLPIGRNGFRAFDTSKFHIKEKDFPAVYNYSTLLQGSTIKVSCEQTKDSPITSFVLSKMNTSNPSRTNMHVSYNFSGASSGGRCQWDYHQDFTVPEGGNLMSFMCGAEDNNPSPIPFNERPPISPFYVFFRPFGDYESGARGLQLGNITCKVEPRMTLNNVTYNSLKNDFTSRIVEEFDTPTLAPTDFEAVDAVYQVFWYGVSKQGNIIADTIVSLRHQNEQDKQSLAKTFENILKGFYEIEMTSLRLYYSANFPPGSRQVAGNLSYFRMGYNGPTEALYALGPLAIVVIMGLCYLAWGLWAGGGMFEFNPTRASSLLVASSQGGLSRLNLGREGSPPLDNLKYPDESSLQNVKVKFGQLPHGMLGLRLHDEHEAENPSPAEYRRLGLCV